MMVACVSGPMVAASSVVVVARKGVVGVQLVTTNSRVGGLPELRWRSGALGSARARCSDAPLYKQMSQGVEP